MKKLLRRLSQFNKTAVPVRYPPKDPRSNPRLNGGVWGPWYKEENKKKKSNKTKAKKMQKKKSKARMRKQLAAHSSIKCHPSVATG